MGRIQTTFTFYAGFPLTCDPASVQQWAEAVKVAASVQCGGYACDWIEGGWIADAVNRRATYDAGDLEKETVFRLTLTCEPGKADAAYQAVCQTMADAALTLALPLDWVHCSESQTIARHVSMIALRAADSVPA